MSNPLFIVGPIDGFFLFAFFLVLVGCLVTVFGRYLGVHQPMSFFLNYHAVE